MTSAEFRCWLDFLGLDTRWVAKQFDVTEKTVRRWAGRDAVPAAAEHAVRQWVEYTERMVSKLTVALVDSNAVSIVAPDDDCPDLVSGMPPRWHRMVSARAAERTHLPIVWKF